MMIACRVRSDEYLARYPWDITIRSKLDSGVKTEFNKIVEGWGDWLFYGHAARDASTVEYWMLIDLAVWRETLLRRGFIFLPEGDPPNVISFTPPLTISARQLRTAVAALRRECAA